MKGRNLTPDHIPDAGKMVPKPDALHDAIRLIAAYAQRAGYAEGAVEALCEQIERLHEPPITVKNRHIRQEWQELRATAARMLAGLAHYETVRKE